MRSIQIINQSTLVSDVDFQAAVAACQRQVSEHFAPAWGGLTCTLVPSTASANSPVNPAGETIYILDDSDQQGALGYHEITDTDEPVGFVFAKTSQEYDDPWQTTLSHELLEQLLDPYIDTCALVEFKSGRRLVPAVVAYEVCDPVEADTYLIDGVPVSNFVLPTWFQTPGTPGLQAPFDYLGKLSSPLALTPGGYISYSTNLKTWHQLSARLHVKAQKYVRHGRRKRGS